MPECLAALAQNLRDEHYQHYFSRFIGHAQLGLFFSTLKRSLWRTLSDPARVPQGRPEDYPPEVRIVPIEHPVLAFTLLEITQDYTEHLYQKKRQKILADAPLIAVPTDTEDQKTRHERKARLKAIAETVLTAIEFNYDPDAVLSPDAQDLEEFAALAELSPTRARVVCGEDGPELIVL